MSEIRFIDASPRVNGGQIWAVAGGKGGTGKTFLVSSLGTHLAKRGNKVVLVDFDVGAANLHSFLNIPQPEQGLTRFFESGFKLDDLMTPGGMDNLSLITGDIGSLASDSIRFFQKLKLFRQVMKLHTQYVLIDLGAGCSRNTLDTFLLADKMIVLVVPEVTAVENLYHFIKNALFRKIKHVLKAYGFKDVADYVWQQRNQLGLKNMRDFIEYLQRTFAVLGPVLPRELEAFKVHIVVNMVRDSRDAEVGALVKSAFIKYLGIEASYAGYIEYDDSVWRSIRERRPFMLHYSTTRCSKAVEALADNLVRGREPLIRWS